VRQPDQDSPRPGAEGAEATEARTEGAEEVPVSIATVVLSPGFQVAAGPGSGGLLLVGYLLFRLAHLLGLPRPELPALLGIGVGVALASVAVTLGVVLVVSKQTPFPRGAVVSIVLGLVAFVCAGPTFLLVRAGPTGP
jgi:hypothetical protein